MSMQLSVDFEFHAAHRLQHHEGLCRRLHGHSYRGRVGVSTGEDTVGALSGMVLDFFTLSEAVGKVIAALDHTTILERTDPLLDNVVTGDNHVITLSLPPTVEVLSEVIHNAVLDTLPSLQSVNRFLEVSVAESSFTCCTAKRQAVPTENRGNRAHSPLSTARLYSEKQAGGYLKAVIAAGIFESRSAPE